MFQLLAVCPMGLEAVVAKEIQELGYETQVENGRIFFEGDAKAIVQCNLWLRTADRIKIVVGRFNASTFDELFEKTKSLPWENIIDKEGQFPVQGRSVKSTLYSVPDCQAITKKAIVERLKKAYDEKGWLNESGAKYPVEVAILKDNVLLTIDTSGSGLNRRGYRIAQGEAPIKETLAASLVRLANWKGDTPFIDPEMVEIAKRNAEEVGLADIIQFSVKDVNTLTIDTDEPVALVGNPPYGERIGDREEVEEMYRYIGKLMNQHSHLSTYILTSNKEFEFLVNRKATKRRKLFNGYIECTYYQYWG
ncbi:MAG: class I SAM-dependent RNA methyltransferase [Staphylococcus haemolyticus]|nr:class I SAM-dependent RNA methyltransferase [Staphylococcus haemolyticus]